MVKVCLTSQGLLSETPPCLTYLNVQPKKGQGHLRVNLRNLFEIQKHPLNSLENCQVRPEDWTADFQEFQGLLLVDGYSGQGTPKVCYGPVFRSTSELEQMVRFPKTESRPGFVRLTASTFSHSEIPNLEAFQAKVGPFPLMIWMDVGKPLLLDALLASNLENLLIIPDEFSAETLARIQAKHRVGALLPYPSEDAQDIPWDLKCGPLSFVPPEGAAAIRVLNFKTDLRAFGGPPLAKQPSNDLIDWVFFEYIPEVQVELEVLTIVCSICGDRQKLDDAFSKFGQDFCSTQCLRQAIKG